MSKKARPRVYMRRISKESRQSLKLWAEGTRETVLGPHILPYGEALDRGWEAERDYVEKVFSEYHARISWKLKDDEEPPTPLPPYDPNAIPESEQLSPEDNLNKIERIKLLNARIRRWLKYRVKKHRMVDAAHLDPAKNPYANLLAQLSRLRSPPKARQAYQQFMHERWTEQIEGPMKKAWFDKARAEHFDVNRQPNAAFRAKIAREVYGKLSPQEQKVWADKAKKEAREAKDKYEAALRDELPQSAEEVQSCIDNLPNFLGPIMNGIMKKTKCKLFVMYGGPFPSNQGEISANHISYGRNRATEQLYFYEWKRQHFDKGIYGHFRDWLQTAYTPDEIEEICQLGKTTTSNAHPSKAPHRDHDAIDSGSTSSPPSGSEDDDDLTSPPVKRTRLGELIRADREASVAATNGTAISTYSPYDPACPDGPLVAPDYNNEQQVKLYNAAKTKRNGSGDSSSIPRKRSRTNNSKRKGQSNNASKTAATPAVPRGVPMVVDTPPLVPPVARVIASGPMDVDPAADVIASQRPVSPPAFAADIIAPQQPVSTLHVESSAPATIIPATSPSSSAVVSHPEPSPMSSSRSTPVSPSSQDPPSSLVDPVASAASTNSSPPTQSPTSSTTTNTASSTPSTAASEDNGAGPGSPSSGADEAATSLTDVPETAPPWFREAYLSVSKQSLGKVWDTLLKHFIAIEKAYNFSNPRIGLSPKKRPLEIQRWVAAGRWRGRDPIIGDPTTFGKSWWQWWGELQPRWRTMINGLPVEREEYGSSWDPLVFPGQNGILSLIASLFWWGCAVTNGGTGSAYNNWVAAVIDTEWMLAGLADFLARDDDV